MTGEVTGTVTGTVPAAQTGGVTATAKAKGTGTVARHPFAVVAAVVVALLLVVPTLVVVPISFTGKASFVFPPDSWSLRWYGNLFSDSRWTSALRRSLWIALLSSVLATTVGTAASVGLTRWRRRRWAAAARALLLVPVFVPAIVLAIGIYTVFGSLGLLGTVTGFVLAHASLGVPFVVISVTAVLQSFDVQLERAAESLGAGRWAVFRQITLPLILPGVLAGALFAFVASFDEILVSLFIKSPFLETFPIRVYQSVDNDTDPTVAAASTLVLVVTTLVILVAVRISTLRTRRLGT
ncbi:ABC transporter permease [Nakamurella endophytica]|uniref:Polyamine ABC transporter permease n=1 Tax=Nakamurella endophytica TaxID=1748367 RepID=A0A917WDD7_9ACTN|nr:ABC transporter permease [Nakamurella endophytica]GGL94857.1 polyamine ABC transporter permease [Nakamurella endophytica]